jgi:predicted nucleic acid-binding protein
VTLDAGALILAERDRRRFGRIVETARRWNDDTIVPAAVIAQAWRGPRSAAIAMILSHVLVEPVDESLAKAAGELLGRSGTRDVVDALVVASAARRNDVIVTSDRGDIERLAAHALGRVRVVEA